MDNKKVVDIAALIKQGGPVCEAVRRGSLEAMKEYIRAGESMVSWKDGLVICIPPKELRKMFEEAISEFRTG